MQQAISLDTLGELDHGAAKVIIDTAIAEAVADLDDRGDDGKPRQVLIVINLERMEGGESENVVTHVEAAAKVPRRRTHGTVSKVGRKDQKTQLFFQTMSPDDPEQRTIDERLSEDQE